MSTSPSTASTWPPVEAVVHPDGSATVTVGGTSTTVHSSTVDEVRGQVLAQITATASKLGRPVRAAVTDAEGPWSLIVHPDGTVDEGQTALPRRGRRPRAATAAAPPAPPAPAAPPLVPTPAVPASGAVQVQVPAPHADNNIRASHFRAALDSADQLVIPVAASHDSADVAEQMMRSLRASGHDRLVDEAVVLIHDLEPDNGDPAYFDVARSIAERFQQQAAAVLPVPFDPALKDGGQIDYARLSEKTQRAYQEAAGAIARTLAAQITQGPA